jgi:hypothetical protein
MEHNELQTLTIDHIKSLGYNVEEIHKQVFWIKDFLTQQELDDVFEVINNATEEEWTHHYMDGLRMLSEQKYGRTDLDNLVEEGLLEITDGWVDKTLSFMHTPIRNKLNEKLRLVFEKVDGVNPKGVGTIQRQYAGVPLKAHIDNHADPSLVYAAVMYLNDDYTDGELYFSNFGIEFKPNTGSMMVFATGEEYEHGVRAPGEGPYRYVLPSFIGRSNFYEEHKEKNYSSY